MDRADITKLAPTLSTKERIKLLISDWQRTLAGEKTLLSEEEQKALMNFTSAEDFKQYEYFESIYKWCGLFVWCEEIEKTILRILIGFQQIDIFEDLQEAVQFLEKEVKKLFEYKMATETIEKGLDLPLFDERTYSKFRSYWSLVGDFVTKYNELIESLSMEELENDELRAVFGNKENCLINNIEPDKEVVTQMVAETKELANAEVELHERIVRTIIERARKL